MNKDELKRVFMKFDKDVLADYLVRLNQHYDQDEAEEYVISTLRRIQLYKDNEVIEKKRQDKENKELNDAFENKRKALLNYMVKLDQKSKKEYQEAEKKCDVLCKKLGI